MKRTGIFVLGLIAVISLITLSFASEKDKGSAMEKGSIKKEFVKKSDSNEWVTANSARAMIKGTDPESQIDGAVDFIETEDGVQVVANISSVTPEGNHGFHIHENGSCEKGGKAAGGHFNPAGTKHGLLPQDGHGEAHAGDMGNITIDDTGSGSHVIFMLGLSLTEGNSNITGKAVILHANEDDFGQPTGNAGGRVGCGIITLNK